MIEHIPTWLIDLFKFVGGGAVFTGVWKLLQFIREGRREKASVGKIVAEASQITISSNLQAFQVTEESMKTWMLQNQRTTQELLTVLRHLNDIEMILDRLIDTIQDLLTCSKSSLKIGKSCLGQLKECNPDTDSISIERQISELDDTLSDIEKEFMRLLSARDAVKNKMSGHQSMPPQSP